MQAAPFIRTRETLMEREEAALAGYGQPSRLSAGRLHLEKPHPYRTEYQRDCARIIHSRAFRRLEAKAQVFLSGTGDHLRTRLTHTMEVASISRSMARALGANEDLAEAIALGHDLGHPPFAHAGETLLNRKMAAHGGFDHNEQSLRILERIEKKYPEFDGLNLSREVLEGLQKHRARVARAAGEPGTCYPLLEAQIADLSDEIAYYSHDLDDGLDSQLLTVEKLQGVAIWGSTQELAQQRYPGIDLVELAPYTIRCLIDRQVADVVEASAARIAARRIQTVEQVRESREALIGYSDAMRKENAALRRFLFQNLYYHPQVLECTESACQLLGMVFDAFMERPALLGNHASARVEADGLPRTVCDYLAGMTDRYLVEEFWRLFPDGGGLDAKVLAMARHYA